MRNQIHIIHKLIHVMAGLVIGLVLHPSASADPVATLNQIKDAVLAEEWETAIRLLDHYEPAKNDWYFDRQELKEHLNQLSKTTRQERQRAQRLDTPESIELICSQLTVVGTLTFGVSLEHALNIIGTLREPKFVEIEGSRQIIWTEDGGEITLIPLYPVDQFGYAHSCTFNKVILNT